MQPWAAMLYAVSQPLLPSLCSRLAGFMTMFSRDCHLWLVALYSLANWICKFQPLPGYR